MKTIAIQIGNTDDKLIQERWADFYNHVSSAIYHRSNEIHFSGASSNYEKWQNAAWIFEIADAEAIRLRSDMNLFCNMFDQDSIAWSDCKTEFIDGSERELK